MTPLSDPVQGMDDLSRDLAGGEIRFGGFDGLIIGEGHISSEEPCILDDGYRCSCSNPVIYRSLTRAWLARIRLYPTN